MEHPFVSQACIGELCFCGAPAAAKVSEEILFDDPLPNRHPLTRYVCKPHFDLMMNPDYSKWGPPCQTGN